LFLLQGLCSVPDYSGASVTPFVFNGAQRRFLREIWLPRKRKVIVAKSRKWGFSTEHIGLGLQETWYTPNWTFRIAAHAEKTCGDFLEIAKTIHRSACARLKSEGFDPREFIPRITNGNGEGSATALEFGDVGSVLIAETAGGKGVGQASRSDHLYLTEYSHWERPERAFKQLSGSQPKSSPFTRLCIDFNADGTTNDAYLKYTRAKLPHTHPDWNGFVPFFAGILDAPELYPPDVMAEELRTLGARRFAEVYPSNDEEMWQSAQTAVWARELVQAAFERSGGKFAGSDGTEYFHGVDTATGRPTGDAQAMFSWARCGTLIWEAAPPIEVRVPEDQFAAIVDRRAREFPGVVVVERPIGTIGAVIPRLVEMGTPGMYRHAQRGKETTTFEIGFPTNYGTKRLMISDTERLLRDGVLVIASEVMRQQMVEYEWRIKTTGDDDRTEVAGNPQREGSHDDVCVAGMLGLQGMLAPSPQVWNPDELLASVAA